MLKAIVAAAAVLLLSGCPKPQETAEQSIARLTGCHVGQFTAHQRASDQENYKVAGCGREWLCMDVLATSGACYDLEDIKRTTERTPR